MAGFSLACISCDQIKTPPKRGFVSRDAVMRDTDHLPYWNHLSGKFQSVRMSHWDALSRCEVTPCGLEVFAKAHHGALWLPVLLATSVIPTTDAIYTGELLRTTTIRALIRLAYASGSARGLYDCPLIANALTCCVPSFHGGHRVSLDSVNLYS